MQSVYKIFIVFASLLLALTSCKKEEFQFGDIKIPTGLNFTTTVTGQNAANPNGNGSGEVVLAITAENALSYTIDFGDGEKLVTQSPSVKHKYNTPGTNTYTITVNAIGTGGATSTLTKQVTVFVAFNIPSAISAGLTGGSSRVWITDHDAPGHFGVGPNTEFSPIWYAASPNSREACAYDDEITFTLVGPNNISINVNNKGQSFSIGGATSFYGMSGGDGCYGINTGGTKTLVFMAATSGSTAAVSTQVQFRVPGNGIINFGTGGTTYEILSISNTSVHLRNIGADGNAWYQKLKVKP